MPESKMKKRRFAIVTVPRSGSTYLRLLLNGHSQIRCHCEVLLNSYGAPDGFGAWLSESRQSVVLKRIWKSRLGWMWFGNYLVRNEWDTFDAAMTYGLGFPAPWVNVNHWHDKNIMDDDFVRDEKVVGIKVMARALEALPYAMHYILSNNWTIIALTRKSIFLRALSWYRKDVTRVAHTDTYGNKKISVNPSAFVRYIERVLRQERRYQEFCRQARVAGCSVVEVAYEDLVQDTKTHFDRICLALNVDIEDATEPAIKRISSIDASSDILNFEELYKYLKGKIDKGNLPSDILGVN